MLDGGARADTMAGGLGNDTYIVNSFADVIIEAANQGIDTVVASSSYALSANVENLILTGTANSNGTGNNLGNTLSGNSGNNTLNGSTGIDTASYATAGAGVSVDLSIAVAQNTGSMGNDRLLSIENLLGSAFSDTLTGNSGKNVLDGGAGDDTLIGGAGNDSFIYDAVDTFVWGGAGTDTIKIAGSNTTVDLTARDDGWTADLEIIDLTGTGNNTLVLSLSDVLAFSSSTDVLRIDGNTGDHVTAIDAINWIMGSDQVIGANTYHSYTQATAQLLIDSDINVL